MHCLSSRNFLLKKNGCRIPISIKIIISPLSTTVTKTPSPGKAVIVDYLMNSFGLSREEAISASTRISPKKTPDDLNRVPDFLKQSGFSDAQIKTLICRTPRYLFFNLDKNIKPKIVFLQGLGFSGSTLAHFILSNPRTLDYGLDSHYVHNGNFLRSFLISNENIVAALKRSGWLFSLNLQKRVLPSIEILKQHGVPEELISRFLLIVPRFFSALKHGLLEEQIAWIENIGLKLDSKLLMYALKSIVPQNIPDLEAKINMFKSFGWSESDVVSAIKKHPALMTYSESRVRALMSFFFEELGYEPREIALKPYLLKLGLKRLVRRKKVLEILNSRGLIKTKELLASVAYFADKKFLEIYVLPYVDVAPDLVEAYMGSAATAEKEKTKEGNLPDLEAKINMFKSFGWSESDVLSAIEKYPYLVEYTETRVRAMMRFYSEELGYEPREIALKPYLLTFSLKKRLVPRIKVLEMLYSKGLVKTKKQLPVAHLSGKKFLKVYVLPYVDVAPDLEEAYMGSAVISEKEKKKGDKT